MLCMLVVVFRETHSELNMERRLVLYGDRFYVDPYTRVNTKISPQIEICRYAMSPLISYESLQDLRYRDSWLSTLDTFAYACTDMNYQNVEHEDEMLCHMLSLKGLSRNPQELLDNWHLWAYLKELVWRED